MVAIALGGGTLADRSPPQAPPCDRNGAASERGCDRTPHGSLITRCRDQLLQDMFQFVEADMGAVETCWIHTHCLQRRRPFQTWPTPTIIEESILQGPPSGSLHDEQICSLPRKPATQREGNMKVYSTAAFLLLELEFQRNLLGDY